MQMSAMLSINIRWTDQLFFCVVAVACFEVHKIYGFLSLPEKKLKTAKAINFAQPITRWYMTAGRCVRQELLNFLVDTLDAPPHELKW